MHKTNCYSKKTNNKKHCNNNILNNCWNWVSHFDSFSPPLKHNIHKPATHLKVVSWFDVGRNHIRHSTNKKKKKTTNFHWIWYILLTVMIHRLLLYGTYYYTESDMSKNTPSPPPPFPYIHKLYTTALEHKHRHSISLVYSLKHSSNAKMMLSVYSI